MESVSNTTVDQTVSQQAVETSHDVYNHGVVLHNKSILVWFVASLFTCYQFCTQVIAGPMTRQLMEEFSLNAVTVSYAVSSFFYMYLVTQIPAGIILDRYSTKYVLPITCFICAVGCLFMAQATDVYYFILARMICGVGASFGFIGTMRVLRNYFPMRYIALFIGFTEMLGFLITAMCEHLVSHYLPLVGFRPILSNLGLIGIVIAIAVYIANHPRCAPSFELAPPVKRGGVMQDLMELATNRELWVLGFIAFSFFSLVTAFAALWGVPALVNIHKFSLTTSTQIISSIFIGIAVGGPLVGYIGSRLSNKKMLMGWCGLLCAALMLAVVQVKQPSISTIVLLLFFCGLLSCCYLLCFTIANEVTAARLSGTAMGFMNMITMASALVMQPVMGYLVALHGPVDIINGAPVYIASGYKRACLAIVLLFMLASFLSSRLKRI